MRTTNQLAGTTLQRLGVVGLPPLTVVGLQLALADSDAEVIPTVLPLAERGFDGCLVHIDGPAELDDLRAIRCRDPELPLVAALSDVTRCEGALAAGASSVVLMSASAKAIARVVESCLAGQPQLPVDLALNMVRLNSLPRPSMQEAALLAGIARGETVTILADRLGYSERHLHRILRRLYERLGVGTRRAAISEAWRRGWLSADGEFVGLQGIQPLSAGPEGSGAVR